MTIVSTDSSSTRDRVREPLTLGSGHQLRNRIIGLPAAGRSGVTSAGWPTDAMKQLYAERAAGGFSLVYVHATIVDPLCTTPAELILADESALAAFSELADAIRSNGALAGIQVISHWQADFPYLMSELSTAEIEETIERHVRGAVLAAKAGFDVINLQASHGWPVQRFISPLTNDRTDRYGSPEYVPTRIMEAVKAAVGDACAISWRLSVNEFVGDSGITPSLIKEQLLPALATAGCDLFDLSLGRSAVLPKVRDHLANETTYSTYDRALANFENFRGSTDVPISVRGRITSMAGVAKALSYGDVVGVGRQAMSDPNFANKILGYDDRLICECIGCNFCLDRVVRQELPVRCAVNWSFNRPFATPPSLPPGAALPRVLVIGGGVTGLTAAVSLARYGTAVTVYEAAAEFGGQVLALRDLAELNLGILYTVVNRLLHDAAAENVGLIASSRADLEVEAASSRWDAIVVATGALPAMSADDVLASVRPASITELLADPHTTVTLLGTGGEGAELAVELVARGNRVTLIDTSGSATKTAYDYDARRAEALDELLESRGVERYDGVQLQRVEQTPDGKTAVRFVAADASTHVVSCERLGLFGRKAARHRGAKDSVEHATLGAVPVLFAGDCVRPLGLAEAVDAGERVALTLANRAITRSAR